MERGYPRMLLSVAKKTGSGFTPFQKYINFTGLVPNDGQFPIATGKDRDLMSTGPMCRYIQDILPMLKIMAGSNKQANLDRQVCSFTGIPFELIQI